MSNESIFWEVTLMVLFIGIILIILWRDKK